MARLAINWLEKNFDLPYRINSIEKDLCDGYLFIQILHQCGQITEDEYENVKQNLSFNNNDPGTALSNFKIVNRALKRWGLGLDKKEVADILLEQPGAAAGVVMSIKRKKEMKPPPPYPAYKDAIKSLRPKEYKRPALGIDPEDPIEKFGRDATKTLEFGTFNEIDMRCQLHEYEVYKNTRDNVIKEEEKIEKEEFQKKRKELYDTLVVREKNIVIKNKEDTKALKTRWLKSFDVKNHRQVRDLQFELATMKIKELKTRNTNRFYDTEQNNGINEFERNLKRSGIGGGDDSAQLATTYEDGMVFMNRIEDIAKTKWPTSAEVGDFISQLKQRTAEKAAARYDKARRRRRMLVEQKAAGGGSLQDEEDEEDDKEDEKQLEAIMKLTQKEEKYQTMLRECKDAMEKMQETAEEKIRIFAEQYRLLADEDAEVRTKELSAVLETRRIKVEERRNAATLFCKELVINLIADVLDGPGTRPQTAQTKSTNNGIKTSKLQAAPTNMNLLLSQNPLQLSNKLLDLIRSSLDSDNYESEITIDDIMSLDIWPSFVTISQNIGSWSVDISETEIEPSNEPMKEPTNEPTSELMNEPPSAAETEVVANNTDDKISISLEDQNSTSINPEINSDNNNNDKDANTNISRTMKVYRQPSFAESTQSILESVLHEYHTSLNSSNSEANNSSSSSSSIDKSLELTALETVNLKSKLENQSQAILIMNGTNESFITKNCYTKIIGMLGSSCNEGGLWDTASSIEAASKMAPLLEGKTIALNFQNLLEIFGTCYITEKTDIDVTCPEALTGVTLSPQVIRVATDMVEAATRVLSVKSSIADGTFSISTCPFIDTTLAILLGQGLWMRAFVVRQFEKAGIACPIPSIAVVSSLVSNKTCIKQSSSSNNASFVAVLDWFYRGGSRDNIPADNTIVATAIQEETSASSKGGGAKKGGKPPAKGKGPEEELAEKSPLLTIIHIDTNTNTNTTNKEPLSSADITPYEIIGEYSSQVPPSPLPTADGVSALQTLAQTNGIKYFPVTFKTMGSSSSNKSSNDNDNTNEISQEAEVTSSSEPLENAVSDNSNNNNNNNNNNDSDSATPSSSSSSSSVSSVSSLLFCNDLSFIEIVLAIIIDTNTNTNTTIDDIKKCIDSRREGIPPASKLWLLHTCQSNPIDIMALFNAYDSFYSYRSIAIEYRALLSMVFAVSILNIEKTIKKQEFEFLNNLKSVDDRWKDTCKAFYEKACKASSKDMNILLGDLICRLGDIIDDRHVKWIEKSSSLRHDAMTEFFRLCKALIEIKSLIGNAMFESLASGKQCTSLLSSMLESASYKEVPWPLKRNSTNSRLAIERYRDNLRTVTVLFDEKLGNTNNDNNDDVWKSLASVEVPSLSSPQGIIKSSLLTELYTEHLEVSISWLLSMMTTMDSVLKSLDQFEAEMRKNILVRHAYEHKCLSEWTAELRADAQPVKYLECYHFNVSNLESMDQIPVPNGSSIIELNDMKLSSTLIRALSEEINTTIYDDNNNNDKKKIQKIFSDAISSLAQKGHLFPHSFRDMKNFRKKFIKNFVDDNDKVNSSVDTQRSVVKSIILSLCYANVPNLPHLEYIIRIANTLGRVATSDINDPSICFSEEGRLPYSNFISKLTSDTIISTGWWPGADEMSVSNMIAAIASCCLDTSKRVVSEEFLLSLCRSPHILDTNIYEKSLLLYRSIDINIHDDATPSNEVLNILPSLLNEGVFKFLKVSSLIRGVEEDADYGYCSEGLQRYLKLHGTSKWIDKIQLNWFLTNTNTNTNTNSNTNSNIFTHCIFGLREQRKSGNNVINNNDVTTANNNDGTNNNNDTTTNNNDDITTNNNDNSEEKTDINNNDTNNNNTNNDDTNNNNTTTNNNDTNTNTNNEKIPYEIQSSNRSLSSSLFISDDICSVFSNSTVLLKRAPFK